MVEAAAGAAVDSYLAGCGVATAAVGLADTVDVLAVFADVTGERAAGETVDRPVEAKDEGGC